MILKNYNIININLIIFYFLFFSSFYIIFVEPSSRYKAKEDVVKIPRFSNSNFKYTCNVDQYSNLNPNSPSYCLFNNNEYTITCLKINDCVLSLNKLKISQSSIFTINLKDSYYGYKDNCNLILPIYTTATGVIISTQWFFQTSNTTGTIIDCEYQNPFIKSSGTDIAFSGFTISNCINSAITSGNIIGSIYSLVTINQMTFINCSNYYISNDNGNNNSNNNSNNLGSNGCGGAIQILYPNTITVLHSEFNNCSSSNRGGAIYLQLETLVSFIQSSTFIECSSGNGGGGAIYSQSLSIRNSLFTNNIVVNGGSGGAITSFNLVIEGSIFRNNSAQLFGGAIYTQDITSTGTNYYDNKVEIMTSSISTEESVYIEKEDGGLGNGTIVNNGNGGGGAIYLHESSKVCELIDNKLFGNHVNGGANGGAIHIYSPQSTSSLFNITDTLIFNNSVTGGGIGGAIYFNKTNIPYIYSGKIYNNTVIMNGFGRQENQQQDQLACDNYSEVNCNLCTSTNCNICEEQKGICIQSGNIFSDSSENSDTNSSSSGEENETIFCYLSKFGCYHGTCSIANTNSSVDKEYYGGNSYDDGSYEFEYKCECDTGYYGSHCRSDNSKAGSSDESDSNSIYSSSSSMEHHNKSSSSSSSSNGSNNSINNNRVLALEISLPIVLGILIIVFIIVLYCVLRRKNLVIIPDQMVIDSGDTDDDYIINNSYNINNNNDRQYLLGRGESDIFL